MRFNQLDGRDFLFADLFRHSHGREKSELIHKWVGSSFAPQLTGLIFAWVAFPALLCRGFHIPPPCGWSVPVRASSPGQESVFLWRSVDQTPPLLICPTAADRWGFLSISESPL